MCKSFTGMWIIFFFIIIIFGLKNKLPCRETTKLPSIPHVFQNITMKIDDFLSVILYV